MRTTGLEFLSDKELNREIDSQRYWYRSGKGTIYYVGSRERLLLALIERDRRKREGRWASP